MKKKLGILFWFVSAPINAIAVWPALFKPGPVYLVGVALLPFLMVTIGIIELRRYRRWDAGKPNRQDIEQEIRRATRSKFQFRSIYHNVVGATHFFAAAWRRAKRNWPTKQVELKQHMARSWSRQERIGVAIFIGGEALFLCATWLLGTAFGLSCYRDTRLMGATLLLLNLLGIMLWVAGDDDDDREHPPRRPQPRPAIGHFRLRTSVVKRRRVLSN